MAKEIFCAIGVDVDAVAGWLGSYGGEDSPDDISRGMFAGEVGTRRLLKLFDKYDMKTTWFIPGHSIETFPEETKMVVDAGHEIGMHGYSHENPIAMTPRAGGGRPRQVHRPDRGGLRAAGRPATSRRGGSSPTSPTSSCSKHGIKYDHSLMHQRLHPVLRPRRRHRGRRSTTRSSPRSG